MPYGKNPHAPNVYECIFKYKDGNGQLGCLAFFRNPNPRERIKWYIKSLHKDDLNRIESTTKEVCWLSPDEQKLLMSTITQ